MYLFICSWLGSSLRKSCYCCLVMVVAWCVEFQISIQWKGGRPQSRNTYCLLFTMFRFIPQIHESLTYRRNRHVEKASKLPWLPRPSNQEARQAAPPATPSAFFLLCYNIHVNSVLSSLLYLNRKQSRWCVKFMLE